MMVLQYLPGAAFFHDAPQQQNASKQYAASLKRRGSKSSQRQPSLLGPLTRLLKNSAQVVNNAVLHVRDGLTEEQRTAQRKLEERKQILYLKLKDVW
jgi:hypothetical protein